MGPELAAQYQFTLGMGLRRCGRVAQAREALGEGIRVAEAHGLNVELFRLERELEALERGEAAERRRTAAAPASIEGVAVAMREMKEAALAGT